MSDLDDIASLLGSDLSSVSKSSAATSSKPTASGKAPIDLSSLAAEMSHDLANVKGTPDIEVVSAEQVRTLVNLLGSAQKSTVEEAAKAMSNLTLQDQNIPTILSNGAIPPLANHLKNPDANVQLQASWALSNLMVSEDGRRMALQHDVCPQLVALLLHPLAPLQERATVAIANLSLDEVPRAQLYQLGAVGPLCNFLRSPEPKMQENAAWALGNMLANVSVQVAIGANEEACRQLVNLLSSPNVDIAERSIRAVANIALLDQNSERLRRVGTIVAVVRLLSHGNADVRFHACRAVNNLAISTSNEDDLIVAGAVEILVSFLDSNSDALVDQAIQALANLCIGAAATSCVVASGGVPRIVKLLSGSLRCKLNSSRTIANIARDGRAADAVREHHGVPALVALLGQEEILKASSLQALANLASASDVNKAAIAQANAGPHIAVLIRSNDPAVSALSATVAAYVTIDTTPATHQLWRDGGVYDACIAVCTTTPDTNTRAQTVSCLANAATDDVNNSTLGGKGAIAAMVRMATDKETIVQQNAAAGILNYSGVAENQLLMRSHMQALVGAISSVHDSLAKSQLIKACINLAVDEQCRHAFRHAGGIPVLVNFLTSSDPAVSQSTCSALFNMSFSPENREEMVKLGAVGKATALTASSVAEVREAGEKLKKHLS